MSTALNAEKLAVEDLDFSVNLLCEHPRHHDDVIYHSEVEPEAVALLGRQCPECGSKHEFLVCNRFLSAILNGSRMFCLDCQAPVISRETIVKLVYL
jgi:hypothetical protein